MRSPITGILQRAMALVDQINSLPQEEKDLVLDLLVPEPEQEVKVKKTRKKRTPKAEKRGLPQTQAGDLLLPPTLDGKIDAEPICGACGNAEDYQDHFKPSPHYHPFQSAPSAKKRSSAKGAAQSSTANSVTAKENVSDVALAASGD
jgi:hypothetical protein